MLLLPTNPITAMGTQRQRNKWTTAMAMPHQRKLHRKIVAPSDVVQLQSSRSRLKLHWPPLQSLTIYEWVTADQHQPADDCKSAVTDETGSMDLDQDLTKAAEKEPPKEAVGKKQGMMSRIRRRLSIAM
jgi:hypothetical protein